MPGYIGEALGAPSLSSAEQYKLAYPLLRIEIKMNTAQSSSPGAWSSCQKRPQSLVRHVGHLPCHTASGVMMLSSASMRRICLSLSSKSRTLLAAMRSCLEDLGTTACRGGSSSRTTIRYHSGMQCLELPSTVTTESRLSAVWHARKF